MDEEKFSVETHHKDLEKYEYKASVSLSEICKMIKEYTNSLLWSDRKQFYSKHSSANVLLSQDGVDCSTISTILADLEKVIQRHKFQLNGGFILTLLVNSKVDCTTVKYQMVKSQDIVQSATGYKSLNSVSDCIIVFYSEVMIYR